MEARQRAGGFHEFTVTGEEGIGPPFTNNDFQGATLLRGGRKNANSNVQQRALGEKVRISKGKMVGEEGFEPPTNGV